MAEYRELPMVPGIARRSKLDGYKATDKYTLNKGHVSFFYNKKSYLHDRWLNLIEELYKRNFDINPSARVVHWSALDKFPQTDWHPDEHAVAVNKQRIDERINQKPQWYRYYGKPLSSDMLP